MSLFLVGNSSPNRLVQPEPIKEDRKPDGRTGEESNYNTRRSSVTSSNKWDATIISTSEQTTLQKTVATEVSLLTSWYFELPGN